jgi:hypothetical protein
MLFDQSSIIVHLEKAIFKWMSLQPQEINIGRSVRLLTIRSQIHEPGQVHRENG